MNKMGMRIGFFSCNLSESQTAQYFYYQHLLVLINIFDKVKNRNLSIGVPKYVKQILTHLKGEIDSNTINRELISMNGSCKQKIKMEISSLNDTLDHIGFLSLSNIPSKRNRMKIFSQVCMEYSPG